MEDAYRAINDILVNLFHEIWELEEKAIITEEFKDLTNNDMHVIEAIGLGEGNNMSSIARLIGADELPAYYAAKGAVTMMTKRDAVAYARYHIRINSVHPGTIMTPLMQDVVSQHPGYLEMDLKRYPMGCFGEPEDVAYAALYLASDEARFVTGAQLTVDGGYTAQ